MATRYRQLKPRPGYSGDDVARHQRGRLHAATIELVDAGGYEALTVAAIIEAAGVSKHTFYENFGGKEACFIATYEVIVRHTVRRILTARGHESCPEEQIRAAALAFSTEVAGRPQAARFALIEALGVIGATSAMQHTHGLFETLLAKSFAVIDDGGFVPPLLVKGIVGGVSRVARARLIAEAESDLPDSSDDLADWVLSFHHPAAARLPIKRLATRSSASGRTDAFPADADRVIGDERAMVLAAAARLAAEQGFASLTVTQIRAAAGVSRRAFDDHFDGINDCLLTAAELQAGQALAELREAFATTDDWARGVQRAIACICERLARDRVLVKLGFSELLVPAADTVRWRARFVTELGSLLYRVMPPDQGRTHLQAEASIGAVVALIHHYVTTGRSRHLPAIAGLLAYLALAPSMGAEPAADLIRIELQPSCGGGLATPH